MLREDFAKEYFREIGRVDGVDSWDETGHFGKTVHYDEDGVAGFAFWEAVNEVH